MTRWADLSEAQKAAHRAKARRAVEVAKATLKPGDIVQRNICGGRRGRFIFTGWCGVWACGKTVSDCHPINIYRVNGRPVNFGDAPLPDQVPA